MEIFFVPKNLHSTIMGCTLVRPGKGVFITTRLQYIHYRYVSVNCTFGLANISETAVI